MTVQTIPFGPGSKTTHAQLSCAWLDDLPRAMKEEFANFRASYGREGPVHQGEISIVDRWHGTEKRVVWHNPPSRPKPPEGSWARVVVYFEDIRRSTEETAKQPASDSDIVFEYGHSSSGIVGTYITLLSVSKSGSVVLRHGLRYPMPVGRTQLTPEELAKLLQTIEEAKFVDFQQCYGQHAPVNPQDSWMSYGRDRKAKVVTWMSDPADPKPPEGWFRIVEILDKIKARAEPLTIREALLEIIAGELNPTPLSITYDDMHGLWGGFTLTIRGDGNVEQKAVKEKAGTPTLVPRGSILELVRLLLKEEAWDQREPQRTPKPDEDRARLVIEYGKQRSEIWEWHNDLDTNRRLAKIRDLMKTIASK